MSQYTYTVNMVDISPPLDLEEIARRYQSFELPASALLCEVGKKAWWPIENILHEKGLIQPSQTHSTASPQILISSESTTSSAATSSTPTISTTANPQPTSSIRSKLQNSNPLVPVPSDDFSAQSLKPMTTSPASSNPTPSESAQPHPHPRPPSVSFDPIDEQDFQEETQPASPSLTPADKAEASATQSKSFVRRSRLPLGKILATTTNLSPEMALQTPFANPAITNALPSLDQQSSQPQLSSASGFATSGQTQALPATSSPTTSSTTQPLRPSATSTVTSSIAAGSTPTTTVVSTVPMAAVDKPPAENSPSKRPEPLPASSSAPAQLANPTAQPASFTPENRQIESASPTALAASKAVEPQSGEGGFATIDEIHGKASSVAVLEYERLEGSANLATAQRIYFLQQNGARLQQIKINLDQGSVCLAPGALHFFKGQMAIQPPIQPPRPTSSGGMAVRVIYEGSAEIFLEPSFHPFLLLKLDQEEIIVDKELFYAAEGTITVSFAIIAGGFGVHDIPQTKLTGSGWAVLKLPVPLREILRYKLQNEKLSVDGNFAILRRGSLQVSLEMPTITSSDFSVAKEGILQTFTGTGEVWLAPTKGIYSKVA